MHAVVYTLLKIRKAQFDTDYAHQACQQTCGNKRWNSLNTAYGYTQNFKR